MFKTSQIAPGVRLVCDKTDKYKMTDVCVSMALPMDENAAANALLVKLLTQSCKAYPGILALNNRLAELYGANISSRVYKIGDAQVLLISGTCLDDKFALNGETILLDFLSLVADLIFSPNLKGTSFGSDNLAREKRLLKEEVLEELDDKGRYAFKKCIEYMCENEPYGRPRVGTIEDIESVKMSDVYSAWKNLLSSALFQITAVGNVNIKKIETLFKSKFKKISREPCTIDTIFLNKPQRFSRHEEKMVANQGKLVIGYRTGMENADDRYYAEMVMVDIFGGGPHSMLFKNIREKQSLAYYCNARLIASKGIVMVQSGIDTDKEKNVSAGVINQLIELRQGKFDDEVIATSKRSIREMFTYSHPDAICDFYAIQILDEEIRSPEQIIEGVEGVTKEEICEAASKMVLDKIFMLSAEAGEVNADED